MCKTLPFDIKCSKTTHYDRVRKIWNFQEQHTYRPSINHLVSFSLFTQPSTKRVMIAFRGTNSINQLLLELAMALAKPCSIGGTGKVGNYFCYYYTTYLREDFLTLMTSLVWEYEGWDFYITGHSLGGAFATLAALDVVHDARYGFEHLKGKLHLYTFGSPRVGG